MRRLAALLICVAALAGCVEVPTGREAAKNPGELGKPGMGNLALSGDRRAIYGFDGLQLVFLIVTDGIALPQGQKVAGNFLTGPRWEGVITPVTAGHKPVVFKATHKKISLSGQDFNFADGRAFVIVTSGQRVEAGQIPLPLPAQIEGIVAADPRFNMQSAGAIPGPAPEPAAPANVAPTPAPVPTPTPAPAK